MQTATKRAPSRMDLSRLVWRFSNPHRVRDRYVGSLEQARPLVVIRAPTSNLYERRAARKGFYSIAGRKLNIRPRARGRPRDRAAAVAVAPDCRYKPPRM